MNLKHLVTKVSDSPRIQVWMMIVCIGLVLVLNGCESRESNQRLQALSILNPERDFTLMDQNGQMFHLKDHRDKTVLLFFGYLSCPDICPVTLSKLSRVYTQLGEKSKKVLTVFVSVDPNRDTPEKLKEYLKYFKINSMGLTGTKEQIDRVVDAFKGYYKMTESSSEAGYFVDHSDYVYVINKQGIVCDLLHSDDEAGKITSAIKKCTE